MEAESNKEALQKSIGPWTLCGLGIGYVISGMYFGWNLGLAEGGTLGMAIATAWVIVLYITFVFTYAELACAIPKAGGTFDYAMAAFGKEMAFVAGAAQLIEFIFIQPAIGYAIGSYLHIFIPQLSVIGIAITIYMLFTLINIIGVKFAVTVEFVVTIIAIAGLLLFAGITLPSFKIENLTQNSFPNGTMGIFAALPFALWFFLGIEGVANVAEETINPQKNIIIGFGGSIITLIVLCLLTFVSSIGVSGWEGVVYDPATHIASDSPLPLVLSYITKEGDFLFNAFVIFGLFGLIASFHGIILAAARATYEFGKYEYLPAFTGKISQRFGTPLYALLFNLVIGIILLISGKTAEIIIISCFAALTLYTISSAAQMRLRKIAPDMKRPFSAPLYPVFPLTAFILSILCLICIGYYYPMQFMIYFLMMIGAYLLFHLYAKKSK